MYVEGNSIRYNDPTGHARPTDESENASKPFSPTWFMRRYPYDEARALDEAQKWLEKHQDYNIFADPDAWGVNNGELVPRNPHLQQMYVLWRASRGEEGLLLEQAKTQQAAWLRIREQYQAQSGLTQSLDSIAASTIGTAGGSVLQGLVNIILDWLGRDAQVKINQHGDIVIHSVDNMRRLRFDLNCPNPHENPHLHLDWYDDGEWYTERIWPNDVDPW